MIVWFDGHSGTLIDDLANLLQSAWAPAVTGLLAWVGTWLTLSGTKSHEQILWRRAVLEKIGTDFYVLAQEQVHRVYHEEFLADPAAVPHFKELAQARLPTLPDALASSIQVLSLSARAKIISEDELAASLEAFNDALFLQQEHDETQLDLLKKQRPLLKAQRDLVIAEVARLLKITI
jgi:hypothetical protein